MAWVMQTRQRQTFAFEAHYVRPPQQPATATPPLVLDLAEKPADTLAVIDPANPLQVIVTTGDTAATWNLRGSALVDGQPVQAVLEITVVRGVAAAVFTPIGQPVDV